MSTAVVPMVEMVGDAELHTLPSGVRVVYHDANHSYWTGATVQADGTAKCSGRLTGISTVVAPFDFNPEFLIRWAARQTCNGVAALYAEAVTADSLDELRQATAWLTSAESVENALTDARLRYSDTRDDAAARGTNVHKHALHALATGASVPRRDELTDAEWGYARGVMAFWHECEPESVYAEQIVADPDLGVAGRFDLIADVTYCGVRHRAMVDAKTSGFLPTKFHAQLAGYRHCAETCGLGETEIGLILQVAADGSYQLLPACATPEDFTAAVDLYRRAARIGRDFNAARKAMAT